MGYRSDVALALTDASFKKMFAFVKDDIVLVELLEGAEIRKKNDWTLLYWSSVKWYDGFKDVAAVNAFVSSLEDSEDQDERDSFDYHIMGEDTDDYKHNGNWDTPFAISLNRSLDFCE